MSGEVQVHGYNAKYVNTFDDLLSERRRRQGLIYIDNGKNLIVNAGSNQIAQLCTGASTSYFTYCGVGSGTNAVSATDTDLQTSIQRIAVTNAYAVSNVAHFDTFWSTSNGNGTWNETAIFVLSSGGTMGSRKILNSSFTKSSSNTATVSWSWTLSPV